MTWKSPGGLAAAMAGIVLFCGATTAQQPPPPIPVPVPMPQVVPAQAAPAQIAPAQTAPAKQPTQAAPANGKPAAPQQPATTMTSKGHGTPMDITADNGIEWQKDQQVYIARGNAVVKRGDMTVRAEMLKAFYREKTVGSSDIYRVEAVGGVVLTQKDSVAKGGHGVYDVDRKTLTLTGDGLSYATSNSHITARDSLVYSDDTKTAVATGDAIAVRNDDRVRADKLTGYFEMQKQPDGKQKRELARVEAVGNVVINNGQNEAHSTNATYNTTSKIAILTGAVKIIHGQDVINGERAEINMMTGVYRMLPGAGGRVTGVLQPDQSNKPDSSAGGSAAPGTPAAKPGAKPAGKPTHPPQKATP